MKSIHVLLLSVLLTVLFGTLIKNVKIKQKSVLISPLVAGTSISLPQTNEPTKDVSVFDWPVFINNYYGYKIKYPNSVTIKNLKNGDVSFQKPKSVNILITQDVLGENDTINTVMEKTINDKRERMRDKFILVDSISPIAVGTSTAQTYGSRENGLEITFFYIPQKDRKYLLVTNQTPNDGGVDYLTSEDIIYSLEFLP